MLQNCLRAIRKNQPSFQQCPFNPTQAGHAELSDMKDKTVFGLNCHGSSQNVSAILVGGLENTFIPT